MKKPKYTSATIVFGQNQKDRHFKDKASAESWIDKLTKEEKAHLGRSFTHATIIRKANCSTTPQQGITPTNLLCHGFSHTKKQYKRSNAAFYGTILK